MNFSTVPPKRSSSPRTCAWYGREDRAHVFGIELLGARGEPDEVDEEHRDDLPLLPAPGCGRVRAAERAEAELLLDRAPAGEAGGHGSV